jgi:FixJ family two-component response regulator
VFVIDPDPATGRLIQGFLQETTLPCQTFGSGREFLAAYQEGQPGCLVLETLIPDMSGLQIQRRLAAGNSLLPLIFVTSRMDVSTAVELMRQGVVHVLEKPVRPVDLHGAIHEAIALDAERRRQQGEQQKMRLHVAGLTRKERQVLQLVGEGKSVKAMASELGVCVRAIELRRRSLMAKLELESPLDLMRFSVGVRQIFVEHPKHDGWRLSPPAPAWPHGDVIALREPA